MRESTEFVMEDKASIIRPVANFFNVVFLLLFAYLFGILDAVILMFQNQAFSMTLEKILLVGIVGLPVLILLFLKKPKFGFFLMTLEFGAILYLVYKIGYVDILNANLLDQGYAYNMISQYTGLPITTFGNILVYGGIGAMWFFLFLSVNFSGLRKFGKGIVFLLFLAIMAVLLLSAFYQNPNLMAGGQMDFQFLKLDVAPWVCLFFPLYLFGRSVGSAVVEKETEEKTVRKPEMAVNPILQPVQQFAYQAPYQQPYPQAYPQPYPQYPPVYPQPYPQGYPQPYPQQAPQNQSRHAKKEQKNKLANFGTSDSRNNAMGAQSNESEFTGSSFGLLGITIWTGFLTIISCFLLLPTAICIKNRWYAKHTTIDGMRLTFDGNAGQLFGKWILWIILIPLTAGIFIFFIPMKFHKWVTYHTHVHD